jgi:hypothetical protein
MRFNPYNKTTEPNIVVDGSRNEHTLLTLSHWPQSGTPAALKADTSAEIVFKYLDSPRFHVPAEVVTNNHFDQDGVIGIFALVDPVTATRYRDLLIDTASAGDFGVFRSRDAARINFALSSLADAETSPFPRQIFERPYPEMAAELYIRVLEVLPRLIAEPGDFKSLWETEDGKLEESERLVKEGIVTIEELRDLDFAVVRIPENLEAGRVHRFTSAQLSELHPLAIYNATPCTRVLLIRGKHAEFQYRYEGWVQLVSRRPAARVDLSGLVDELNLEEDSGGRWTFDGVDEITPRLHLDGQATTSIPPDLIRGKIEHHLRTGAQAWDPYDSLLAGSI